MPVVTIQDFAPIEMPGRNLPVRLERRRIRNAYARVRDDCVVIELPLHMGPIRSKAVSDLLYRRIRRSIEKNPNRYAEMRELAFRDGQTLNMLGRTFTICIKPSAGARAAHSSFDSGVVAVTVPASYRKEKADALAAKLVIRHVSMEVQKELERRVAFFNDRHFHSVIPNVTIRAASKVMGSCSPDNSIMVSFRMLYADQRMLDYIIVHELAHTKFRDHSERFWALVASILPDYKETRKWLRNNLSTLAAG